jgi:hypothetical protein
MGMTVALLNATFFRRKIIWKSSVECVSDRKSPHQGTKRAQTGHNAATQAWLA